MADVVKQPNGQEASPTGTSSHASPIDVEALTQALTAGVAEAIAPLTAKVDALATAKTDAGEGGGTGLTLDAVKGLLDERDKARATSDAEAATKAETQARIDAHLKKCADAKKPIPTADAKAFKGDDLEAEEQAIRKVMEADDAARGGHAPAPAGEQPQGQSPGALTATENLSSGEKIKLGLG